MAADEWIPAIVVDNGSGMFKAGFAFEDAPDVAFPTITGRPYTQVSTDRNECYVGDEAQTRRDVLSIDYPMERGLITNWDDMEKIWSHAFLKSLRTEPAEHPILISDTALNPKSHREKMTQTMFESFDAPAFYISLTAVLSEYASGRGTGIVLEVGDGTASIVPIYEGYTEPQSIQRLDFAGRDITTYLSSLLRERGYSFSTYAELETVREIKERFCYCAQDYQDELHKSKTSQQAEKRFELPDGQVISLGNECFRAPEMLFQPSLFGLGNTGVHDLLYSSVRKFSHEAQKDFYCNFIMAGGSTMFSGLGNNGVHDLLSSSEKFSHEAQRDYIYVNFVIAGGSTMFPGFPERMQKELSSVLPRVRVKVVAPPERKYSAWIGGSIISSLTMFQNMWMTKEEYYEHGPTLIHRKCFPVAL